MKAGIQPVQFGAVLLWKQPERGTKDHEDIEIWNFKSKHQMKNIILRGQGKNQELVEAFELPEENTAAVRKDLETMLNGMGWHPMPMLYVPELTLAEKDKLQQVTDRFLDITA